MTRLIRMISLIGALVSIALITFVTLGITANIISRAVFGSSIVWMLQAVQYALIAITFSGAAWVLLEDRHTRLDVLLYAVPPRVTKALLRIGDAIGFVVLSAMTYYSVVAIIRSQESGAFVYEYLEHPEWWLFLGLPFGFGMMALVFLLRLLNRQKTERDRSSVSAL